MTDPNTWAIYVRRTGARTHRFDQIERAAAHLQTKPHARQILPEKNSGFAWNIISVIAKDPAKDYKREEDYTEGLQEIKKYTERESRTGDQRLPAGNERSRREYGF